jgi:hypothetical protein
VDAGNGELAWQHSPVSDVRMIPSNGKLISPWPVRTGALVQDGVVYYCASLLPWRPSYVCAVDAQSGRTKFVGLDNGVTLQGSLLASKQVLYAPQGRSVPLTYDMIAGGRQASLGGSGGVFCILTEEEQLIAMPSSQKEKQDELSIRDPKNNNAALLTLSGTKRMIVKDNLAYLHQGKEVAALDRKRLSDLQVGRANLQRELGELGKLAAEAKKKQEALKNPPPDAQNPQADALNPQAGEKQPQEDAQSLEAEIQRLEEEMKRKREEMAAGEKQMPECFLWRKAMAEPLCFMLAGDTLFVGLNGGVRALDVKSGDELWQTVVKGRVYGMTAANGRLFLSTDDGSILCYASN